MLLKYKYPQPIYSPFTRRSMEVRLMAIGVTAIINVLIEKSIHPTDYYVMLVIMLFVAVGMDFVSGVLKSMSKGEPIVSDKIRRTTVKAGNYMIIAIGSWVISFIVSFKGKAFGDEVGCIINDTCVLFMVWNELVSICENVIEIDNNGRMSKVIKPIHLILTWKFKDGLLDILGRQYESEKKKEQGE